MGFIPISDRSVLYASVGMDHLRLLAGCKYSFLDSIHNIACFKSWSQFPGDDLPGEQIHDAREISKALSGMDICNVCAPDGIWLFRRKVPVEYIPELIREVLTMSSDSIWSDPTGSYTHFAHISRYSAFSGFEAFLMKLLRDLWRTIYAEAFIIYLADLRFDEFLLFAAIAGFAIKPVIITAFRNT